MFGIIRDDDLQLAQFLDMFCEQNVVDRCGLDVWSRTRCYIKWVVGARPQEGTASKLWLLFRTPGEDSFGLKGTMILHCHHGHCKMQVTHHLHQVISHSRLITRYLCTVTRHVQGIRGKSTIVFKGARSDCFNFFFKLSEIWKSEESSYFFSLSLVNFTAEKCTVWKINENVTSYSNHN